MKKVHFIWAHPRTDSLTAQVVNSMKNHAEKNGLMVSELDLYRSNFNPTLYEIDEPRWNDPNYQYSEEVKDLFENLKGNDTLFIVFPVWWYSFPAILKGYIDRVWNYGLAYGNGNKLPVDKIRWIALTGDVQESFERRGNDKHIKHLVIDSLSSYCGVKNAEVKFLYDTIGFEGQRGQDHFDDLLKQANEVVEEILD